ncbi:MAG: M23 family metallopeptidase [Sulfuricurvum sp.]|nr:M23 family metallopeptidase [Sulfuricurvum sp.]
MRILFLTLIQSGILFAETSPILFDTLADPLQKSTESIKKLSQSSVMEPNKKILKSFVNEVESTLSVGKELTGNTIDRELLALYLKELRELSQQKESIDSLYRKSLTTAMVHSDKKSFEILVSAPLEPLHHPRIRSDAIAFYQKNYPQNSIQNMEALCDEESLEDKSIQMAIEQEQAYEEHLRILKRSEVKGIRRDIKIGSRNSVIVVKEKMADGTIVFEAENINPYLVTLALDFDKLDNVKSDHPLPLYVELSGKMKKEILRLIPINANVQTNEISSYGWVKGSAFAQHDDTYLYRLPFALGVNVDVSQGYNGGLSHKGLSAYAIDFSAPIGTPVYAAREGEVVGMDVTHTEGGPSPEYRPYMNYINIRHSDGTLGNYFHLKQGGSVVKIGQQIKRGDLIGYSGSTGYCTAPHLHFSVSKVDPISMRRPMNVPIKIQTAQGIVFSPQKGDRYTVQ